MKSKNDRRSRRTRQALGDALLELMMEKGYEAVSVKDIIDRANVGRSTFYAHYADKDELFMSQWERVVELLSQSIPPGVSDGNPFFPSLGLFQHVQEQWQRYQSHIRFSPESGLDLHARQLQKSIGERIERRLLTGGKVLDVPAPIVASFLAGSFLSVLRWWLENKMPYSPERMDAIFCKLALPGVAQYMA